MWLQISHFVYCKVCNLYGLLSIISEVRFLSLYMPFSYDFACLILPLYCVLLELSLRFQLNTRSYVQLLILFLSKKKRTPKINYLLILIASISMYVQKNEK